MFVVTLVLVGIVSSQLGVEVSGDCSSVSRTSVEPVYGYVKVNETSWGLCEGFYEGNESAYEYGCEKGVVEVEKYVKVGEDEVTYTKEICRDYSVSAGDTLYRLDFEDWGACKQEKVNSCVEITCVSKLDGAHNGRFTDCNFGKSCQKFVICENGVKTYYKNSQEGWLENDPTFKIDKLEVQKCGSFV